MYKPNLFAQMDLGLTRFKEVALRVRVSACVQDSVWQCVCENEGLSHAACAGAEAVTHSCWEQCNQGSHAPRPQPAYITGASSVCLLYATLLPCLLL